VRFLVEYRSVIVEFGEAVATAFALKLIRAWGTDVVAMFANVGRASKEWWTAEKTAVPTVAQVRRDYNLALLEGVRANQELLDQAAQRAQVESETAAVEEENARIQRALAAEAVQDSRSQVEALRLQQEARLRLVQTMEVEQAAALEQLQTGRLVTGQYVSRAQAMAEFQAATSRLATAETMLARTDAELAAAEGTLIARTGELTAAESLLATASENASNAFVREAATAEAAAAAVTLGERAAAAGALAVEGLGVAIKFALGPWGLLIALAYQAASAMGVFENSADKAAAAADRMANHFAKAGDAADVARRKGQLADEASRLSASIALREDRIRRTGSDGLNGAGMSLEDEKARLAYVNGALKNYSNAEKTAFDDHWKQVTDNYTNSATQGIEHFKRAMYAADQKQWQAINELQKTDPKKAGLLASRLTDMEDARVRGQETAQIQNLDRLIAANKGNKNAVDALRQSQGALVQQFDMTSTAQLRQQAMQGASEKGASKAATALAHLGEQAAVAEAKSKGLGTALAKVNYDIEHGVGAYKNMSAAQKEQARGLAASIDAAHQAMRGMSADKSFDNRLDQMAGRIAELRAKLADGSTTAELAKFNAEVAAGLYKGVTQDRINQMREYAKIFDDLSHQSEVKGLSDKLDKDLVKATTDSEELWKSFANGTLDADKRADDLQGRLMGMVSALKLTGQPLEDMLVKIRAIVQETKDGQAAIEAARITKEADKINSGLGNGSKLDTARAELNTEIRLEYQRVVVSKEGTAARKRELDAFYKWRAAKEAQFNRENESAVVQQARQWSNLAANLQEAYANIAGSFVDMLTSGKMDVKQFAVDIIKEIAKIIIEAMIAYAILSAIGMTPTNAGGGKMSFGQFLGSGIQNSFAMTPAGKHHDGGIIGDGRMDGMFPADLWKDAMRYHNGGVIGLQPNEVPIIGLKGERVLTEDEQKQIAAGGSNTPPPVTVNVVNNGKEQMHPDVSTHFNGKEMIVNVVLEAASKTGPLRDALTSLAKK
jgi:hypothetical protein